ncbi:hypothetical protein SU60_02455 [Vibrio mytili]|uniref:Uncharacterized protein n=1 Tax=Vibrio mytili TaxID=50718 RepID=A0A0C3IB27_9VIBR|nr:hypothetical protein SU60_02455 [Vibrio mytili]
MLKRCFPNASLKCGANHSKLAQAVKRFCFVFTSNAAFLGKDGRNSAFCLAFIQKDTIFPSLFTILDVFTAYLLLKYSEPIFNKHQACLFFY